jgi:hypothetical protein
MLDKTSKKIIKYLASCDEHQYFYYDDLPEYLGPEDENYAAIRFLKDKNYVEIITNQNDSHIGVRLSHIAMHRQEFSHIQFFEYLKDKWIDIMALILSILAFIGAFRNEIENIIETLFN